jgi:signal transduction histidine kinase
VVEQSAKLAYHGFRAMEKSFNVELITNLDPKLPKIEGIQQDIGRTLLNIITNAFHAVTERSKKEEKGYKPEVIITTDMNEKKQILISIKDNGSGIPEAIKDKIFQPFFTTKPAGQGTGLGLSMSNDIIKAHGGNIEVETESGMGARFIIHLPF